MENEKQMTKKIRYLSLFTGIGGFERGIETSKHNPYMECVGYSEVDKYATSIYERHYPNHTRLGDATKIQTEELQDFDFLVGGFPCQAFSHAGKRMGFNDTRGTLFFEIARILKDKKPRYFLLENVKGLLSHDKGNTFTTMLQILADLGYDVQWQIYNSKNYGVAQNRERLYIKGFSRERERCPREILPISGASTETDARHGQIAPIPLNDKKQAQRVYSTDGVSPTLCANGGGDGGKTGLYLIPGGTRVAKVDSERYVPCTTEGNMFTIMTRHRDMKFEKRQDNYVCRKNNNQYSIRRLTPIECERLQGFPDNWTKYGVDDELISDTQRYKCCGNAVTVNVVRDIMNDWNILEEKEDLE